MKRRVVLGLAVLIFIVLAAASALVLSRPEVRARWHLRRVSSSEVMWLRLTSLSTPRLTPGFTGHAEAFAESPCARDLLPDLVERARAESARDEAIAYRALLVSVASTVLEAEKIGPVAYIDSRGAAKARPGGTDGEPWPPDVLGVLVTSLRSKNVELRMWTLSKLPHDPRVLAATLSYASRAYASLPEDATSDDMVEVDRIGEWFDRFAMGHPEVVGDAEGTNSWPAIIKFHAWGTLVKQALDEWLKSNRSRLPKQIEPR